MSETKIGKIEFGPSASTLENALKNCIDMQAQDKIKELKSLQEKLEKQLEIAREALAKIAQGKGTLFFRAQDTAYLVDDFAREALQEMEKVKNEKSNH